MLKSVERFDFDCCLGIVSVGDGKFLVARGGSAKGKGHTGRLLSAVSNMQTGLTFVEK